MKKETIANKEKSCENCRYYSQHFSKQGTRIEHIFCGHCINRNNKKMKPLLCEFWEDITIKKEEQKKSIKETLEFIAERLDEISIILKDDEE